MKNSFPDHAADQQNSLGGSAFRYGPGLRTGIAAFGIMVFSPSQFVPAQLSAGLASPFVNSAHERRAEEHEGITERRPWNLPTIPARGRRVTQQMVEDALDED